MFRSFIRLNTFTLHALPISWHKPHITQNDMKYHLQYAKENNIKTINIDNKYIGKTSPYIYEETIRLCKESFDNIILTISEHDYNGLTIQENINIFANYRKAGVSTIHLPKNWINKTEGIYATNANFIDIIQEQQIPLWFTCVLQMNGINSINSFNEYLDWMVKVKCQNVLVKQMYIQSPKLSIYNISDHHINFMTSNYVPIDWLIKHYVKYPYNTQYVSHTLKHNSKIIQILFETMQNNNWILCTNGLVYTDSTNKSTQIK